MALVIEFSKLTGDFASLSLTDLKVIALTHTFELEVNGYQNLKSEPTFEVRFQFVSISHDLDL